MMNQKTGSAPMIQIIRQIFFLFVLCLLRFDRDDLGEAGDVKNLHDRFVGANHFHGSGFADSLLRAKKHSESGR